jgi:ribose transport system ATP-binding protein
VIFISHRLIEIGAVCDRATVLREGSTVGVVDVTEGSEDRIVGLMLGDIVRGGPVVATEAASGPARAAESVPRLTARGLTVGSKLLDVSFDLHPGEVLGVVALEGQGQDELFDVLSGSERPDSGELHVDGVARSFRHPADAIRAGLVYFAAWGPIDIRDEKRKVDGAIATLQIDTRAAGEVRRLSGGNQQKVTIARWVAGGVRTMLCFDPTRGIDIGTKQQIYQLLRDLASAGAAVLLYTSELKEIQLACDRAIVIFGGRIVAEVDAAEADEATLLRAAYDLRPEELMPEELAAAATSVEPADAGAGARV